MSEEKNTSANAIVIYQSMYKQFLQLSKKNPEMAIEYITALLKYGFEGIEPDEDSDVMMYGFDADKASGAPCDRRVKYDKCDKTDATDASNTTNATMRQNLDIDIDIEKDIETETEKEQDPLDKWDETAYAYLPDDLRLRIKRSRSSS